MTRILVDAAFEVVCMFRGLRDSIAMERLLSAFDRRTRYPRLYQAFDAKPAPLIRFSGGYGSYRLDLTAREGQFILYFDDGTPGSIPARQILGATASDLDQVIDRAWETLRWFADEQQKLGYSDRHAGYVKYIQSWAYAFSDVEAERAAFARYCDIRLATMPRNPTNLNGLANDAARLAVPERLAACRIQQGQATENLIAEGDPRFTVKTAQQYYVFALDALDGEMTKRSGELRQTAEAGLSRLEAIS